MAAHRRVQSAQATPGRLPTQPTQPTQYNPPIYPPDAPDYDYNPHSPQPPPPPPPPLRRSGPSSSSYFTPGPATLAFPEPQLFRSTSVSSAPAARPTFTISDYGAGDAFNSAYSIAEESLDSYPYSAGGSAFPNPYGSTRQFSESSYSVGGGDAYSFTTSESPERSPSLVHSPLSQDADPIRRFQENLLREDDEEWHRLVPEEARASLPEKEVKRQSVIFEVIKSEKEYVADLEALQDVFLTPLFDVRLPIIDFERQAKFRDDVFFNFDRILGHELRLLAALYERQREQHPVITSLTDVILDVVLAFRDDYESYIKHYPLAEARHRRELTRSEAYKTFLSETGKDPRVRKRDLITFISRPVTRLPRLKLILEQVQKYTPEDHADHETMSLSLTILSDFLKSTQPGIQAAEARAKFLALGENLVFRKTELIDMDLYGETRTVVHEGIVGRKEKTESFSRERWLDNSAKLLDHYLLLTEERATKDPGKGTETNKYYVNSRPIPLDFLRLGSFIDLADQRKEEITSETSFSDRVFRPTRPMYPFTVYHAGSLRRYILYASSEAERNKWKKVLEETKNLRDVYMDGNKLFAFNAIQDGRFRSRTILVPSSVAKDGFTGRITSVAAFRSQERNFLAIATEDGIYVGQRDSLDRSERILKLPNVAHMGALPSHDRFVLIFEKTLLSYSLKLLASAALGQTSLKQLEQTMETLAPQQKGNVAFFRVGSFGEQDYLVYGTPGLRHTTIHTLLITHGVFQRREGNSASLPAIAYDAYFMSKRYAIITEKGITVLDPNDYTKVITAPDFSESHANAALAALKSKCESAKTLGIVSVSQHERLVIYDEHGCYIDKYGVPTRNCKWVRWEIKAKSFSYRHPHVLLFGEDFIDIRHAPTGQFKQTVEKKNIWLLDSVGMGGWKGSLFLVWRGAHSDKHGQSWALVEGLETAPLEVPKTPPPALNESFAMPVPVLSVATQPPPNTELMWDEWG